jgi:DNA primase
MAYDTAEIKEHADLLDLVSHDTQLRRVTGGGEHAGPCPRCGGRDRFHCTAEWWFCRQCYPLDNGQPHDVIAYVMWRDNVDFATACQTLGGQEEGGYQGRSRSEMALYGSAVQRAPVSTEAEAPTDAWQDRARAFCDWAQEQLWQDGEALAYLRGRGLSDETIRGAGLGYNPRELRDDPARWGLVEERRKVWLPRGWVIPCESAEELCVPAKLAYVKVRRLDADLSRERDRGRDPQKYIAIKGSKVGGAIYGLDALQGHAEGVICESELDALLLRQYLAPDGHEIAGVAGLPGANTRPGADTLAILGPLTRMHVCFDLDRAGDDAREWWGQFSGKVRELVPLAHDVTDMWREGHDLAAWAIPQLGPRDPERRTAWLVHHLDRLDAAAFDCGGDDAAPTLAAWLALYRELCTVEGWASPDR